MTISQRNALATAWLQEGGTSSGNNIVPVLPSNAGGDMADGEESDSSTCSSHSSSSEQKDVLETWMLMVGVLAQVVGMQLTWLRFAVHLP